MSAFSNVHLNLNLSEIPELVDSDESLLTLLDDLDGLFEPDENDGEVIDCEFVPFLPDEETMKQYQLLMTDEEIFDLDNSLEELLGIR